MTLKRVLHILRNPEGVALREKKEVYLMAADMIEQYIREKDFWRVRQHKRVA